MKKSYNSPATNVAVSRLRASILTGSNSGLQNNGGAGAQASVPGSGSGGGNQGQPGDDAGARVRGNSLGF